MKWMRFRVRTTAAAEDILISSMQDVGLYGAQIEDHVPLTAAEKEQMFVDILPDAGEDDGSAILSFYAEENGDGLPLIDGEPMPPETVAARMGEVIAQLRQYSDVIGDGTVTIEETEDLDWVNNWKQYFHQFRIDDILVIPSWEEPEEPDFEPALTFHIDPGTAFGTGAHETTQLCIRRIRRYLWESGTITTGGTSAAVDAKGNAAPARKSETATAEETKECRILDIGTGSGILSILSLMLGVSSAVGTDLDPCAQAAVEDNLNANGVDPSRFHLILGNLVTDRAVQDEVGYERYDIVAANILPDVLIPLTPAAVRAMAPGGIYITSGILEGKESSVADAMRAEGLEILDITAQGEWRCVTGRKSAL